MEFCLLQIISFHVPYNRKKKIIKKAEKSPAVLFECCRAFSMQKDELNFWL